MIDTNMLKWEQELKNEGKSEGLKTVAKTMKAVGIPIGTIMLVMGFSEEELRLVLGGDR